MARRMLKSIPRSNLYASGAAGIIREGRRMGVRRELLRKMVKRHKQARDVLKEI